MEAIYKKFGVPQKECENIEAFLNELKVMSQDRPLLFDSISSDLNRQYEHIRGQMSTMKDSIDAYKKITLKKKVYELAKGMVGRDHFFNIN